MNLKTFITLFFLGSVGISWPQTSVTFNLTHTDSSKYKYVGLRGNQSPLNWETSIPLERKGRVYTTTLEFEDNIEGIEFKYVLYNFNKNVEWENLVDRRLKFNGRSSIKMNHGWNKEEKVDITTLKKISSKELLEDFKLIETMVLEVHPGTYRYKDKDEIQKALTTLKKAFLNDLAHGEAYLAISRLLAQIECDHTFTSFYNQDPILKAVIHDQPDKLPFTFSWINGIMVVELDVSSRNMQSGTQVLKINGISTSEILERLLPYTKADGATNKSRTKRLEIKGYPFRYNAFDVFHPLLFEIENKCTLDIKDTNGAKRVVQIELMTRGERAGKLNDKYPDFAFTKEKLWGYDKLEDNIGLIRAGTFDDYGMDRDWRKYFANIFKEIRKDEIKHLIVDLRENQGGFDEIGLGLMRRLIKSSGTIDGFVSKSRYRDFPQLLKPYAKSWGKPWFYELEVLTEKDAQGYFLLPEESESVIKPVKNAFKGDVYYLVSPANVSMAFYIANAIKKNGLGTLIGEETGGNQRGINGGQILFLRLPNSRIEIDFPVEGSFSKEMNAPNQGVLPDIIINKSISDIVDGVDPQLEKALELIKKK